MIQAWIDEIKEKTDPEQLGMILAHNGIVRATSKQGTPVSRMKLSYDREKLETATREYLKKDGIVAIRVWINSGELEIGDDIMFLVVAGRFRTDVLPVFESFLSFIKNEIVRENEME